MNSVPLSPQSKPVLPPISHTPDVPLAEDETVQRAREAVAALREAGDFVSNPFKYSAIVSNLKDMAVQLRETGLVPFCRSIVKEGLCELIKKSWGILGMHDPLEWTQLDAKQDVAISNFEILLLLLLTCTDTGNADIISEIVGNGMLGFVLEPLSTDLLHPSKHSKHQSQFTLTFLGSLYNIVKKWDKGLESVRALNGFTQTLPRYTSSSDPAVKTLAIILMTFLLSEDEQKKMLESTEANIRYTVKVLEDCLQSDSKGHVSGQYGYSAAEIMDGLSRMAAVEVNKEKIVACGALLLYAKVLQGTEFSAEEQEEACKGLWTLAFSPSNKAAIAADPVCMEGLKRLTASPVKNVQIASEGALWVIEGAERHVQALSAKSTESNSIEKPEETNKQAGHVMLSYNWAIQQQVIRIKDSLKAAGYRVWIDVEQMSGSTLEGMSKGVEDASLVLIFYTEKYKLSSACRLEAEYTYNRGKKFIPVRMEAGYKPDGWLGILLANKLYFDFTKDAQWDVVFQKLCTEIARVLQGSAQGMVAADGAAAIDSAAVPLQPVLRSFPLATANYSTLKTNGWAEADVQKWLQQSALDHYGEKFTRFSGSHVVSLRRLMDSAPEFFYRAMKQDFGFEIIDLLTFANMLQVLE